MKKRFMLAGGVTLVCLVLFLMSCNKEDSCFCTETDYNGYTASQNLDPESFGAKNCSDLAVKLRIQAVTAGRADLDYSCN